MQTRDCLQKERPFSHASHSAHHRQHLRESASQQLVTDSWPVSENANQRLFSEREAILIVSPLLKGNMHHIQLRLAPQCIAFV